MARLLGKQGERAEGDIMMLTSLVGNDARAVAGTLLSCPFFILSLSF